MKKAGDLFSAIIDEDMLGKAREYSRLFSAWEQLTQKHGIAAAASHTFLSDIKRDILLVEADHPGWIQLLQTKKHLLLNDMQAAFPSLGINGIAFKLGSPARSPGQPEAVQEEITAEVPEHNAGEKSLSQKSGYKDIKNKDLAEKLKNLEKSMRDFKQ